VLLAIGIAAALALLVAFWPSIALAFDRPASTSSSGPAKSGGASGGLLGSGGILGGHGPLAAPTLLDPTSNPLGAGVLIAPMFNPLWTVGAALGLVGVPTAGGRTSAATDRLCGLQDRKTGRVWCWTRIALSGKCSELTGKYSDGVEIAHTPSGISECGVVTS
jgi:hypothetical protein